MFRLWVGFALVLGAGCQRSEAGVGSDARTQQAPAQWVLHQVSPAQSVRLFAFDDRAVALRYLKDTNSPFVVYALQGHPPADNWLLASEDVGAMRIPRPTEWRFVEASTVTIDASQGALAQWQISPQSRFDCPRSSLAATGRATQLDRAAGAYAALPLTQHWQVWFDTSGLLRLGSDFCQQVRMPWNFLAQRTAGFYTTGFIVAVDALMQTSNSQTLTVPPTTRNHALRAAAYQLQARGLLRREGDGYVPVDESVWRDVVARAQESLASYTFRGLTSNPNAELGHLIESEAFDRVLEETPAGDRSRQLQHHGHVWVPLMTLLNHALNARGVGYIQALTDGSGLAQADASTGAQRAMELLMADGLVYQQGDRWYATRLGLDALPKLARWSGLLASYSGLGDGAQLSRQLAAPEFMASVDDRYLNVASSGAGLQRFAQDFVLPRLGSIQGLQGIVGVGSGSGGLERMLYDHFGQTVDIFGSDLDETDSHGNHALEVARAALQDIIPAGRIFPADIRDPDGLFAAVREQYRSEGLSELEIEQKMANMAVTSGFITHEPRSFSPSDVTTMLNGYAKHAAHFMLLELPLVDPAIHAQQTDAHFGVELGTFHLASGQTVRPLSEWIAIIDASGYRIEAQSEFNKVWNPHTGKYDIPTYVGFHLVRK